MVEFGLIIVEDVCDNLSLAVMQMEQSAHIERERHTHTQHKQKERAKLWRETETVVKEWAAGTNKRGQVKDEENPITETVRTTGLKAE